MRKVYYHATPFENKDKVLTEGIHTGCDGVVYLCKRPDEAAKFVIIRGYKKILALGVVVEENMVEESFDHSEAFFKCKAYMYPEGIPSSCFVDARIYEL